MDSWSSGAAHLKGYAPEEILGHEYETFFPPEQVAAGRPQRVLEVARTNGSARDEGWRVRKDGSRFWADARVSAALDHSSRLVGFTNVTRCLDSLPRKASGNPDQADTAEMEAAGAHNEAPAAL